MKDKYKLKILVACHKADSAIRQDNVYMPIQVGKALHPELELGFQCDNTGDNISEKNASYCELTAIYWAWKNLKNTDYIGLCHYRRYFDFDFSDEKRINAIFGKKYDLIAVKDCMLGNRVYQDLVSFITWEHYAIMIDTIIQEHPEMYEAVCRYFYSNNAYSVFNMFIAPKALYDEYCEFLFPLLEKVETRIKPYPYARLQRSLGYMAEAIQGLWIMHKNLKVKRVDAITPQPHNNSRSMVRNLMIGYLRMRNSLRLKLPRNNNIYIYDAVVVGLKQNGVALNAIHSANINHSKK